MKGPLGVVLALGVMVAQGVQAADTAIGWRGDGTGKFAVEEPPTTWTRVSRTVESLRYQADKAPDGDPGRPMADGVIRRWLVLGPVPLSEDADFNADTLPGESEFTPEEGQKAGDLAWRSVALDTAYLDFAAQLGKAPDKIAYALARVYSPTGGVFRMNLTHVGKIRVLLNGKACPPMGGRFKLDLAKGWNRLLLKVSPGENDWYVVPVLHAYAPAEYREQNLAWRTPLPGAAPGFYGGGMGVASPVVVGRKMFVVSEPFDLVCLDKTDGKVLWLRRSSYFEAASNEERQNPAYEEARSVAAKIDAINTAFVAQEASDKQLQDKGQLEKDLQKQMKRVSPDRYAPETAPDVGSSGFTPTTDGRHIYVWFASGVAACYDLEGNRRWLTVERRPAVEHGFSSSPLLIGGKLVVFMRDLLAYDAATGQKAWEVPLVSHEGLNPEGYFHGSPVATTIGTTPVIVLGNGALVRAADGKVLFAAPDVGKQSVASPVVEGRLAVQISSVGMEMFLRTLPAATDEPMQVITRTLKLDTSPYPKHYLPWYLASPVIHEGLAYLMNNAGVLTVVDVSAGQVVYQKLLDLDAFQWHNEGPARGLGVSPTLAGKYLYLFGNNGAALVIVPGREFRQVAKNKIESVVMPGHWSERQERFIASPVFDGNRLYLRGEDSLYAIGPK